MQESFTGTTRKVEQDCVEMKKLLQQRGWEIVNGVVRSISPGLGLYYPVEEGVVSVFSPKENAERRLPINPAMASQTTIAMPYVMLAHKAFRYGWLNSIGIAGGNIAGINGYKLAEKS